MNDTLEAERAVLGSVIIENNSYFEISDLVKPEHFAVSLHAELWTLLSEMIQRGQLVDPITIRSEVKRRDITEAGDKSFLADLMESPYKVHNVRTYAQRLVNSWLLRRLAEVGSTIKADAENSESGVIDPSAVLQRAEAAVFSLSDNESSSGAKHISEILPHVSDVIDGNVEPPIPTGFRDLDAILLGGMRRKNMIVLAARPSQGKTTCAINVILNAAIAGHHTAFFSVEMGDEGIALNMAIRTAEVNASRVYRGDVEPDEAEKLNAALGVIHNLPIEIDEAGGLTPMQLLSECRRISSRKRLDLVVVDYLQMMTGEGNSDYERISHISKHLKELSKIIDVPVLVLAQLSRASENRENRWPRMADLRGSGNIEQDADVIIMLHRPEVEEPEKEEFKGKAYLTVKKQRNGPTGQAIMNYTKEQFSFWDRLDYGIHG